METCAIVFFIGVSCIFIALYFLSRHEIKNITSQLKDINLKETNAKLLRTSSNKQIGDLIIEINKSLEIKNKTKVKYKRIDEELRQAITNMSHDLRTPLTSIMGYIQLMGDDSISKEEKEQYRIIVEKRAKVLQGLINGFYDLSRLEAKEYSFELKPIKLNNLLYEVMALFYEDLSKKGIEPTIDITNKVNSIIGDENAIRRIFSNLIQNILRYGDSRVSITLMEGKNELITIFKNDGCTLKNQDSQNLFQRFFTGDKSRTGQSTGLGLAITKRLVEQMGHNIYAEIKNGELTITVEWKNTKNL